MYQHKYRVPARGMGAGEAEAGSSLPVVDLSDVDHSPLRGGRGMGVSSPLGAAMRCLLTRRCRGMAGLLASSQLPGKSISSYSGLRVCNPWGEVMPVAVETLCWRSVVEMHVDLNVNTNSLRPGTTGDGTRLDRRITRREPTGCSAPNQSL